MKTKIILFLLCLCTLSAAGQVKREKCPTCRVLKVNCPYKGKYPTPEPESMQKTMAKCKSCGNVISQCQYKGSHPVKKQNQTPQQSRAFYSNETFTVNGVTFTMVPVEGGTFTMGAHDNQASDAWNNEKPTHQVTLSSYYIGETEVTQGLWKAVMGNNPSNWKGDNLPVEEVSWNDCQGFIKKLNSLTGKTFRLPTEAEWEFVARGGNKSKDFIYSGSNNLDDVAWYWKNSGDEYLNGSDDDWDSDKIDKNNCKTHPVKTKQPNELGIYDMSGNVWEWCQDWKGYYSSSSQTNPTGPDSGAYRVCRGGSWYFNSRYCRSSDRRNFTPDFRNYCLGLRLVLSEQLATLAKTKEDRNKPVEQSNDLNTDKEDIKNKVIVIIRDKLGVDIEEITLKAKLSEDLGADELDIEELKMDFEKEFLISFPDDYINIFSTVSNVINYIKKNKTNSGSVAKPYVKPQERNL